VPAPAQTMIANVFANVTVVPRVVNNVLQGNWNGAERELSRFLLNSTAGVGGLFDAATDSHITKSPADFGQTLGKWGIGPGPYLVVPFMEPLTVRDGIGKLVDRAIDPLTYVVPLIAASLPSPRGVRSSCGSCARSDPRIRRVVVEYVVPPAPLALTDRGCEDR